jgi:YfiH family protein
MKFNHWKINQTNVVALTTSRLGGISQQPFNKLNLAYHSKDLSTNVSHNRAALLSHLGLSKSQWVLTYQSHSDKLMKVIQTDRGKGADSFESGVPADALYTYEKNLAIGIFHADCVPVFLYNPHQKWVGIIHAGTEGTLKKITQKSILQLIRDEKTNPEDILAYLGPSLDFAHHPISMERKDQIIRMDAQFAHAIKFIAGKYFLDVPLMNLMQLRVAGVPFKNIENSNIDTFSNPELYFSYLREQETGRHISLIYLLK